MEKNENQEQQKLREILRDFTIKEKWDNFLTIRAYNGSLEGYAEWPQIREPLLACLATTTTPAPGSSSSPSPPRPLQILIPVCGSSGLSEHLYDAGFHCISNIDFSKVAITEMLRRNVRSRPEMKWRVMDMTKMQFVDETFDAVIDKGGLDALMEPVLGHKLGNQYLLEVKRVLQKGGKFICLTLSESHVLGILFPKFRYGWRVSVHDLPQKPSNEPSLQTFMVIAEKESSSMLQMISLSFDPISLPSKGDQVRGLSQALETENKVRGEIFNGSDILYTLEDLQFGAKGDLAELRPGLRVQLTMGEDGLSRFVYRAVLLDSPQQSDSVPFLNDCGVFLVSKTHAHLWIFCSEEGQWIIVERSTKARLLMVFLDSSHSEASMDEIEYDLSPLVKQLEPWKSASGAEIQIYTSNDGIKERKLIHQVTSSLTGLIILDEVVYEKVDDDFLHPSEDLLFRRLTFQGSQNLDQFEALLKTEESLKVADEKERKNTHSSKSKKRGNRRRNESNASPIDHSIYGLKVDLDHLASAYHSGMISGFVLISTYLERMASTGQSVKATIIGLGAGLLPMFLHGCLPFLHIEVVELDPVVQDLAKDFFSFREDERLKVHVADGILFVREAAKSKSAAEMSASGENEDAGCSAVPSVSCDSSLEPPQIGEVSNRVDILIVDVSSYDSSSGLACPSADFVEESFLLTVKDYISEQGLLILNLLSRSPSMKALVISRMKMVFCSLYSFEIEEDVHEVIFALNTNVPTFIHLPEASQKLKKLLKLNNPTSGERIIEGINNIKNLM